MTRFIAAAAAAALLAGCGEDAPAPKANERAAQLDAGLYEISQTVADISSTDHSTPATQLKAGEPVGGEPRQICVGDDGALSAAAFAESNDSCDADNSYMRGGRLSMQLKCRRPGRDGPVMQTVDGRFTTDSFEAEVSTTTYFIGDGDYQMRRQVTGQRVGDCPPEGAGESE